jgi:hypothetical protein
MKFGSVPVNKRAIRLTVTVRTTPSERKIPSTLMGFFVASLLG